MKRYHETIQPKVVREPVQVYLAPDDQTRLVRLTSQLDTTKSDVLRRGLEALERQLSDPAQHPALRAMTLGDGAMTAPVSFDVAREHDRFLADSEVASWQGTRRKKRGR